MPPRTIEFQQPRMNLSMRDQGTFRRPSFRFKQMTNFTVNSVKMKVDPRKLDQRND